MLNEENLGKINISNEVVANIVSIAAAEIDGVSGFSNAGIHWLRKKDLNKGIDVTINNNSVKISLSVILKFGFKIPEVSWNIQQNVKRRIEDMTGLTVGNIDIYVKGIDFENEKNEKTEIKKEKDE